MPMTENEADPAVRDGALLALGRAVRDTGYGFVTPTPLTHARVNARAGNARARTLRDVFGWSRPFDERVVPAPLIGLMREAGVLEPVDEGWRSRVRLSSLADMLFVHSAYPTVAADAVFFGPDTYRFARAIDAHLASGKPPRRAVDIGCGAGPGAAIVARAGPEAEVAMVDINGAALRFARVNAALNGIANARALHSDLLTAVEGAFDLIVSNPPYLVDPGGRAYRHGGGRFGEGLSLAILDVSLARLAPGGTLLLYTGSAVVDGNDLFREAVSRRLHGTRHAWSCVEVDPDVFGEELEGRLYAAADRIAAVTLTVTTKD